MIIDMNVQIHIKYNVYVEKAYDTMYMSVM